jgi:hypothetical protein
VVLNLYKLSNDVPKLLLSADLEKLLSAFDISLSEILKYFYGFNSLLSPDTIKEILTGDLYNDWIDTLLLSNGIELERDFPNTVFTYDRKLKLLQFLPIIRKNRGCRTGIVSGVNTILGYPIQLKVFNTDGWLLGVDGYSNLGVNTSLGASRGAWWKIGYSRLGVDTCLRSIDYARPIYSFDVYVNIPLTVIVENEVKDVVNFLKPFHTHIRNVIQGITGSWQLGIEEFSRLGINTVLL